MGNSIGILQVTEKDVIRTLSPNETMNRTDHDFPVEYWVAGRSAIDAIRTCLVSAHKSGSEIQHILDFPCGHGRVLRYLKAAFPHAELTACDLLRDGVDFCSSVFGAIPVYSDEDVAEIPLGENGYDLIWVGSLLTHLDSDRWEAFLIKLASCLRDGGVVVFTTHGASVYKRMKGVEDFYNCGLPYWRITKVLYRYEQAGFGYADYLGAHGYGFSISAPQWVLSTISRHRDLRCVLYADRGWHNLQDVYACVKSTKPVKTEIATPLTTYVKHLLREVWKPKPTS